MANTISYLAGVMKFGIDNNKMKGKVMYKNKWLYVLWYLWNDLSLNKLNNNKTLKTTQPAAMYIKFAGGSWLIKNNTEIKIPPIANK